MKGCSNMNKNDDKILALKKRVEAKKATVGPVKRFSPLTSCSIELDGTRYNLHTMNQESLIFLLCKLTTLDAAAEKLGYVEQCMISGFPTNDWIADIQTKLEIMAQKSDLEKLKAMEAQLNKLLSDDKKTELEIDSIAAMLGLQ